MTPFIDSQNPFAENKQSIGIKDNPFSLNGVSSGLGLVRPSLGNKSRDVGSLLASGKTSEVEATKNSDDNYNFFSFGNGVTTAEVSSVNVQEQTALLSAFKTAYSNFNAFPNKNTALALKQAYYGDNGGNTPIIDNKNVKLLFEGKKQKIEELLQT